MGRAIFWRQGTYPIKYEEYESHYQENQRLNADSFVCLRSIIIRMWGTKSYTCIKISEINGNPESFDWRE